MLKLPNALLCGALLATLLSGQQAGTSPSKNGPSKPANPSIDQKEIEKLRAEVTALRTEIGSLTSSSQQQMRWWAEAWGDIDLLKHEKATFDPTSPGPYARIDTTIGPMLISVGKAEPYLDGYKVALQIGNPLSVTFNGFDIHAAWGPRFKEGDDYGAWSKTKQEKKITRTESLYPGRWAILDIILPSTDPKNFGYLQLSVEINQVFLPIATP